MEMMPVKLLLLDTNYSTLSEPVAIRQGVYRGTLSLRNLVRKPDFHIRWSAKDRPEHWRYNGAKDYWTSDNIRVEPGKSYRAGVTCKAPAKVTVQWKQQHCLALGEPIQLPPEAGRVVAPSAAIYAELLVAGRADPSIAIESVHFAP